MRNRRVSYNRRDPIGDANSKDFQVKKITELFFFFSNLSLIDPRMSIMNTNEKLNFYPKSIWYNLIPKFEKFFLLLVLGFLETEG